VLRSADGRPPDLRRRHGDQRCVLARRALLGQRVDRIRRRQARLDERKSWV